MSLDKAIKSGKEHREEYRKGKAIHPPCRNHGGCSNCEKKRFYNTNKGLFVAKDMEKEYAQ